MARPESPAPSNGAGAPTVEMGGRSPAKLADVAANQAAEARVETESQFFIANFPLKPVAPAKAYGQVTGASDSKDGQA